MTSNGRPLDFEEADRRRTSSASRRRAVQLEGQLDFSTCTECGVQSQCPPGTPASGPVAEAASCFSLRDHAYAKAPYLLAGGDKATEEALAKVDVLALAERRPLIGG